MVRLRLMLNLLDCMDFRLAPREIIKIKENLEVGGATPSVALPNFIPGGQSSQLAFVKYREVVDALHFNHELKAWTLSNLKRQNRLKSYHPLEQAEDYITKNKTATTL